MNFQEFKERFEREKVEEYINQTVEKPLVSVCVMTYNQASYIKDCLNGILMQETDFPIEILLGDDASTDGTREICMEYARKYHEKIRLFLHHRQNNIKIGGKPTGRFNFLYNLYSARGKYIALCEGDDCWIDPLKLQKQVEFIDKNKDCSIVFTGFRIQKKSGQFTTEKFKGSNKMTAEEYFTYDINSAYKGAYYYTRTMTLLFRKEVITNTPHQDWMNNAFAADFILKHRALAIGNFGYINSVTSTYNANALGSFSNQKHSIQDIKKQYRDYLRALYYLNKLRPIDEIILKEKVLSIRKRIHFLLANCRVNKFSGFLYLCYNIRKTSLFYILLFIKRSIV